MKIQTKNLLKSIVSLALCLSMVLCTPLMAFAEENNGTVTPKKADIVYVSIGDSMTNGYCLEGYDGDSGGINYGNDTYSNLFAKYLAGDADSIEDDQVIFDGTDDGENGRIVDHRQLAISGMRSQDIQWILELDYADSALMEDIFEYYAEHNKDGCSQDQWYGEWEFCGDIRTYNDYCNPNFRYPDAAARILTVYNDENGNGYGYYKTSDKYLVENAIANAVAGVANDPYYPEQIKETKYEQVNEFGGYRSLQIATEFYQKSVADADIISLSVGNTNFGTHMLNEFFETLMNGKNNFTSQFNLVKAKEMANADPISKKIVEDLLADQTYNYVKNNMCTNFSGGNGNLKAYFEYIVDYCTIGYIASYVGMLNAILELKDGEDVEIIILPLMNAYEPESQINADGTLGQLVEAIYAPINKILCELPAAYAASYPKANFYFAEDCYVSCMVDVFGDDFYIDSEGEFVPYDPNNGFLDGNPNNYTPNKKSTVRERFAGEIASGTMFFCVLDKVGEGGFDLLKGASKKYHLSKNLYNFLYGGKVVSNNGFSYEGCGAVTYDMMTDAEKAAYAIENPKAAMEYAFYLAYENAIIRSGTEEVTFNTLASLANLESTLGVFYSSYLLPELTKRSSNYAGRAAAAIAANSNGFMTKEDVLGLVQKFNSDISNDEKANISYEFVAKKINEIAKQEVGGDLPPELENVITAVDVKLLCDAGDNYNDVVYEIVAEKAKSFHDGITEERIKMLMKNEDGAFMVVADLSGGFFDVNYVKNQYPNGNAKIVEYVDMLIMLKTAIGSLIEFKDAIQGGPAMIEAAVSNFSTLAMLLGLPQNFSDMLYEYGDGLMRGALCLDARILLGTGAGGHPSPIGHENLYDSIIEVFDYTVSDAVWNEDFSKCTVTRTFSDGSTKTAVAEGKDKIKSETIKAANCKEAGIMKYTADFAEFWAATQTKEVEIPVTDHDYTKFTAPTWTWTDDYKVSAIFTCPDCNTPVDVTEDVTISGETTLEADCSKEGKYVYTAEVEFKGTKYTSTKEKAIEKLEHNYGEDGRCENILLDGTVCGEYNLAQYGQCLPTVNAELTSGKTLTMLLDGTNLGEFTFTETDSGWTIANANGKYLASDANGNFVLSDSAYSWNYSDGKFSTTVKVPGTTWYEQLLGITKDVTYYLAVSDGSVTVNATGSSVAFTTTANNGYHTFNGVTVIEPNCTEEGHTERVCTVCGETFKTDVTPSLGHNHVPTVHAPLCGIKGYTEYTCSVCGDSYTGDEVPALEHDFNDNDECNNCHKSQLELSGGCSEKVESSVSNGEYILSLGGTEVGTYTFASVNGGWSIKDANGKYLSVDSNGNLVLSDSAFAWTYSNGKFSATVGKASTNWIEALLGMNKKSTTYYLVASGSSVATSTTGADAKFYTEVSNATHTFNKIDHAASCGIDAYSEYVCDVCGYTFVKEFDGTALQHSYSVTETVAVTCVTDGYNVYTCSHCSDSYNADFVSAIGSHSFGEDGTCENIINGNVCGEPEEPDCVYVTEQTLTSGKTYELSLGGNSVGEYTFTSVSGGWNIMNSEGKYLAVEGGKLVVSDSPFAWTYSNGRFSSSSSAGTGISWLDMILGSKKSTYYLASSGNNVTVSTSTTAATAKFAAEVTGEHNYSGAKPVDGNHVYTCHNCGYNKVEICNDDNCAICNASVNVSVNIEETTSGNWIELLLGKGKKTNKVTITTVASGTEVTSVEYSLNGTTWTKGTVFTSKTAVTNFNIRVQAANGITYNYLYNNGSVSAI